MFSNKLGTIFQTCVITLNNLPGVVIVLSNLTVPGNAPPAGGGKIPLLASRASRSARMGITTTPSKKTYHL